MFFFCIFVGSIPANCIPGVTRHLWHPNRAFFNVLTSDVFNVGPDYADFGFYGSFCPKENGNYRMIVEGTLDSVCEDLYSSFTFANYSGKSRTTPYQFLQSGACYQYYIWASTCKFSSWGKLSVQKEDQIATLFTTENSFNCPNSFCLQDESVFPNCFNQKTASNRYKSPSILSLLLIIT